MQSTWSEVSGVMCASPPPPQPPLRRSFSKTMLCKLSQSVKKSLKVLVLGQAGVGKSALTVRFLTRRFIGDYDPTLEDIYNHETMVNNELVIFQILDSGGHSKETEQFHLEANIRWAEAFVLMYSVTDKCSFDECIRLKFFINLYTRRRRVLATAFCRDLLDVPVLLVANKIDQLGDRMVSTAEGRKRCKDIGCVSFHEISVRESIEDVQRVFAEVHARWKMWHLAQKSRRISPESSFSKSIRDFFKPPICFPQRVTSECSLRHQNSQDSPSDTIPEMFRARACTDGSLQAAERWRSRKANVRFATGTNSPLKARRMSFSMKGSTSS